MSVEVNEILKQAMVFLPIVWFEAVMDVRRTLRNARLNGNSFPKSGIFPPQGSFYKLYELGRKSTVGTHFLIKVTSFYGFEELIRICVEGHIFKIR